MSYQEKRSYAQIVGNITGFIIYFLFVVDLKTISEIDQVTFGKYLFLIVPVLVITQVIVKILFDIVNNTHTKGEEPTFVDEYDQIIELKSVRNFMFVFVFGFFATMLGLWFNLSLTSAFLIMLCFIFIAGSTLELSYIYFYRRGV
jgi:hypothetical protein